jgi:hypothetical protein
MLMFVASYIRMDKVCMLALLVGRKRLNRRGVSLGNYAGLLGECAYRIETIHYIGCRFGHLQLNKA